ncbi:MAG: hypothetical protein ACK56F_13560 [bacterium]
MLAQVRIISRLTARVRTRQLGLVKPCGLLYRVLGLGWMWLRAQSLDGMACSPSKDGESNQFIINLSLSGGLAGGAGGAGKKWFTISEGWQTTNPSIPLTVVQPLRF